MAQELIPLNELLNSEEFIAAPYEKKVSRWTLGFARLSLLPEEKRSFKSSTLEGLRQRSTFSATNTSLK